MVTIKGNNEPLQSLNNTDFSKALHLQTSVLTLAKIMKNKLAVRKRELIVKFKRMSSSALPSVGNWSPLNQNSREGVQ